jgi:hypothetical protein
MHSRFEQLKRLEQFERFWGIAPPFRFFLTRQKTLGFLMNLDNGLKIVGSCGSPQSTRNDQTRKIKYA